MSPSLGQLYGRWRQKRATSQTSIHNHLSTTGLALEIVLGLENTEFQSCHRSIGKICHSLGEAFCSIACKWAASRITWFGGRAQKTRQYLGSAKPGSARAGLSIRRRNGSIMTSLNSDDRNFSFCCKFLVTLCVEYRVWISALSTC